MIGAWLERKFPPHKRKFIMVGVVMTGINSGLLTLMVTGFGMSPVVANWIRVPFSTQLHFAIHRLYTFRHCRKQSILGQWWRFHVAKAASTALNQLLFWVLAGVMGVQYLIAYVTCVIVVGWLNLGTSDKYVFCGEGERNDA